MRRRRSALSVAFLDLILISLICFVAILALIQINPESKVPPAIETRGKFLIVIQWEDGSGDDVDIYVRDPKGEVVYFQNRDIGLMHLEYDDMGTRTDTMMSVAGEEVKIDRNEERVVLRGTLAGEYVVNVQMYSKRELKPAEVTVILYQLIGNDKELVRKKRTLTRSGDEMTGFRFTVTEAETIRGINELPHAIVRKVHGAGGGRLR